MMLGTFLLSALIATTSHAAQSLDASHGIAPEQLYNAPNRPLMVNIHAPLPRVQLAMMDHDGVLLAEPVPVRVGRLDLAETFPRLWDVRQTAYVQIVAVEDELTSFGTAMVLQPMLAPGTPLTTTDVHPTTGLITTRITGWQPPDNPAFSGFRAYVEQDVMLHTTHGDMHIALRPDHAPNTAWNFRQLAGGGFYNGIVFHRIVPMTAAGDPFVIQAGDPSGTGSGGPGYELALEPSELEHDFGVISMARADGPDTAGSQFFICLSRAGTSRLDGQYAAFGYAVDGASSVLAIADVELADVAAGRPARPPVIRRAVLVPAPPRTIGTGRPDSRISIRDDTPAQAPTGRVPR